jgi:transposase
LTKLTSSLYLDLFQPLELRGRLSYPNLSAHNFTANEKDYFIDVVVPSLKDSEGLSFNDICRSYNLNIDRIKKWKQRKNKGIKLQEKAGKPSLINDKYLHYICDGAVEAENKSEPLTDVNVTNLVHTTAQTSCNERNVPYAPMSTKSVQRVIKKANLTKRKAQSITTARYEACSDPTMSYCMYLMLKAFTTDVPTQLLFNWDFTQFIYDESDTVLSWVVADRERSRPISAKGDASLPIAIKYMHMGSADGYVAPMVLMVAIPEMKEGEFVVKQVPGLSQINALNSHGYLIFCTSRCGNDLVFQWFLENIVINTIEEVRKAFRLYVSLQRIIYL